MPRRVIGIDPVVGESTSTPILVHEGNVPTPEGPEQFQLLPNLRPRGTFSRVNPAEIAIPPTVAPADLQASIDAVGILQPVVLIATGEVGTPGPLYTIAAGRRRVQAARNLNLAQIPAYIFPVGTPSHLAHAFALSENNLRSPNPVTDYDAIAAMRLAGATEQQIAHDLHISLNTVRARLRLGNLHPALRAAVDAGQLSVSLADRISRLDGERQLSLVDQVALGGRVRAEDVREVTQAVRRQQIEALPDEAFHEESEALTPDQQVAGWPLPANLQARIMLGEDNNFQVLFHQREGGALVTNVGVSVVELTIEARQRLAVAPPVFAVDEAPVGWPRVRQLLTQAQELMPVEASGISDVVAGCLTDALQVLPTAAPTPARRR